MDIKTVTKVTLVISSAILLLEAETAAIIVAVSDMCRKIEVPQQTMAFISFGILYAAGILGIQTFKSNGNGNGDKNA